jgi:hypothetical protein
MLDFVEIRWLWEGGSGHPWLEGTCGGGIGGSSVLKEELGEFVESVVASPGERGVAQGVVFGVDVGAVFDEEFGDVGASFLASKDEGRSAVYGSGVDVRTVVDEVLGDSWGAGEHEWGFAIGCGGVDVVAVLEGFTDGVEVSGFTSSK